MSWRIERHKLDYAVLSELVPLTVPFLAEGVVRLPGFLTEEVMERYCTLRSKIGPDGWPVGTPYQDYQELLDVCLYPPLVQKMREIMGDPMGVHLNLTGWVSTERDWHSDHYLNPESVGDHYLAAWFALDDIKPESGPFQYVRGSHLWPVIRRERVFRYLTKEEQTNADWPWFTESWVAKACADEIAAREAEVVTYLPKRGDVLLWHSYLVHRGSKPTVPGTERKSLIAHYSSINHRPDMQFKTEDGGKSYFAHFPSASRSSFPPRTRP